MVTAGSLWSWMLSNPVSSATSEEGCEPLGKRPFSHAHAQEKKARSQRMFIRVGVTFLVLLAGSHSCRRPRCSPLQLWGISVTTSRCHWQSTERGWEDRSPRALMTQTAATAPTPLTASWGPPLFSTSAVKRGWGKYKAKRESFSPDLQDPTENLDVF